MWLVSLLGQRGQNKIRSSKSGVSTERTNRVTMPNTLLHKHNNLRYLRRSVCNLETTEITLDYVYLFISHDISTYTPAVSLFSNDSEVIFTFIYRILTLHRIFWRHNETKTIIND